MITAFFIFGLCFAFLVGLEIGHEYRNRTYFGPWYVCVAFVAVLALTVALTLFFAQ